MEPTLSNVQQGSRVSLSVKLLGLAVGAAIAIGAMSLYFGSMAPDSLVNRINAYLLPVELDDTFFLYQQEGTNSNTLYTIGNGTYETVSLGTTLPTVFLSRRDGHTASIQLGEQNSYEVRTDADLRYVSPDLKTSVAVSPNGMRVAFAQSDRAAVEAAHAAHLARYGSNVFLQEGSAVPTNLGEGFSPFFISDDEMAWFADEGLMKHDIRTGSTSVMNVSVKALPPPYPAPAVSRDGHLIAWVTPETGTVHLGLVSGESMTEVATHEGVKAPTISLGSDALYVLEHTMEGTTVWQYALKSGSAPVRVPGLPTAGRIIQLVP